MISVRLGTLHYKDIAGLRAYAGRHACPGRDMNPWMSGRAGQGGAGLSSSAAVLRPLGSSLMPLRHSARHHLDNLGTQTVSFLAPNPSSPTHFVILADAGIHDFHDSWIPGCSRE